MSYSQNAELLAQQIGTDMAALNTSISSLQAVDGTLANLTTSDKSSLVSALNELKSSLTASASSLTTSINNEVTARNAALAAEVTARANAVTAMRDQILGGAGTAYDTLQELQQAIQTTGADAIAVLNNIAALRVGVDAAQNFSAGQKAMGRSNIDAASQTDLAALTAAIGNTSSNLVEIYNTAKAAISWSFDMTTPPSFDASLAKSFDH